MVNKVLVGLRLAAAETTVNKVLVGLRKPATRLAAAGTTIAPKEASDSTSEAKRIQTEGRASAPPSPWPRREIMFYKSRTCMSKSGNPLSAYETFEEAAESAEYQERSYGRVLHPYRCGKCGDYHLSPLNGRYACGCTDRSGNAKMLYPTYADAEEAANERSRDVPWGLRVYECPERRGYHLTHC